MSAIQSHIAIEKGITTIIMISAIVAK